jgi:hypothetical protein
MGTRISRHTKNELVVILRQRYRDATKREKTKILDEFVALAECHRKYAVRLLGNDGLTSRTPAIGRRIYDDAVKEALIITWEAADRVCGKRLKAVLPYLVEAMERHGHLDLDPYVRARVLAPM